MYHDGAWEITVSRHMRPAKRTEHALVELVPGQARVAPRFTSERETHGRAGIPEHGTSKDHSIVANRTLIRDVRLSLTIYYVSPSGHADQPNWIQSLVTLLRF